MDRLTNYIRSSAAEMKHVSWPTQNQALIYTAIVIGISAVVSLFLAFFDYIFTGFLNAFITTI